MLEELLIPHINIILVTVCMLPLYAIGVFLFIIAPCMALSIAFPTIFDRKLLKDNWLINVAAFFISIVCGVFLVTGLSLSYTFVHDTFTVNQGLNRPLTENEKTFEENDYIILQPKNYIDQNLADIEMIEKKNFDDDTTRNICTELAIKEFIRKVHHDTKED